MKRINLLLLSLAASSIVLGQEPTESVSVHQPVEVSAAQSAEDEKTAGVQFAYTAGAELHAAYIWRGMYEGGLSIQPDVEIGYDGEHTSLRVAAWASLGASDWKFQKDATYFVPELDLSAMFNFYGATIGFTHYYYFGGSNFLSWQPLEILEKLDETDTPSTSQTEVTVGYDFSELLNIPLHLSWSTMVAGNDYYRDDVTGKLVRAYSSYLEIGYDFELPKDITLGLTVGLSPWKGYYTDYDKSFAFNNLSISFEKTWDFGVCELSLLAQGMLNTCNLRLDNAFLPTAGEEKVEQQKLMGTIGLGVWF